MASSAIYDDVKELLQTEDRKSLDSRLDSRVINILYEKIGKIEDFMESKPYNMTEEVWLEKLDEMKQGVIENLPVAILEELKRRKDNG